MNNVTKIDITWLAIDGSNWVTYRDRINITLRMRRWQDHLTSSSITQAYIDRGDINGIKPAMRWEDDDKVVKHLIMHSIPDDIFNRIKGGTDAREWWESLKKICEGRSRSLLIDLGRKLQNTHCGEDDDVRAHFAKLANLHKQLAAMGETVADNQYANILLASLPSCYDMRVCAITTNADDTGKDIDPAKIVKHISDDYDKRMLGKNKPDDQAFTALTQHKYKDKRNIECYNCKKMGHIKADCWAKGGGKEGQRPQRGKKRDNKDKSKDSAASATDTGNDIESWAVLVSDLEEDLYEEDRESSSWSFVEEEQSADKDSEDLFEALSDDPQDQAASASGDTEAELYDSGASKHISPF